MGVAYHFKHVVFSLVTQVIEERVSKPLLMDPHSFSVVHVYESGYPKPLHGWSILNQTSSTFNVHVHPRSLILKLINDQ